MKAFAPNGREICGILEIIVGVAILSENGYAKDEKTGLIDPDYTGTTQVDWNSQTPVIKAGQKVFVDEDGGHWLEDELVLK